ncbi:sensor histidine kinase [Streptomyces buecherae]|uniref:Sensor histidine kinase n=1 Tax=Streptomyces buecherae TaxID=2763006 RepID=A0A7H8N588_9ACTN|nr:sensor histidine kinase [Streptomyces buecherae]QKW49622.1 sensor histidine kinase [Streptomyces buecherae]
MAWWERIGARLRQRAARGADGASGARDEGPSEWVLVPWLLLASGAAVDVWQGEVAQRWWAAAGLAAFVACYLAAIFVGSAPARRRVAVLFLLPAAALACALGSAYGGSWLTLFSLLSLATGVTVRAPAVLPALLGVVAVGVLSAAFGGRPDEVLTVAYSSLLSGAVVAIIRRLIVTVHELHDTRDELTRSAVERERLRFSRDLHDLLGHTMSVVVVKAEAVRRLTPRDPEAALAQAADIEAIGRQALTEIREAVTGYREGSLATELDRARSLLDAAGMTAVVRQSGPPLPAQTEALLGWVVREGVTNTVRHSGATRCEIELRTGADEVRLTIVDDGTGGAAGPAGTAGTAGTAETAEAAGTTGERPTGPSERGATRPGGGTGLAGLTERLAAAGGTLRSGPAGRRGFRLTATLPVDLAAPYPGAEGAPGDGADGGAARQ